MKKLLAFTSIGAGALLLAIPRYILPACEYEGFARMHCTDTAIAEYVAGALLLGTGAFLFAAKRSWFVIAGGIAACGILAAAYYLPDVYGYCASKNMPCHYGMVPGVRFTSVTAFIILIPGLAAQVKQARKNILS